MVPPEEFLLYTVNTPLLKYLCATVIKSAKLFACDGLSSFLHFYFVHDFIKYFCAIVTKAVKNFGLRQAFFTPAFLFRSRFHKVFLCVCDKGCQKFWPADCFLHSCISILTYKFLPYEGIF